MSRVPTCPDCGAEVGTGVSWLGRAEVFECECLQVLLCPVEPCEMAADHDGPHVAYVHDKPGDAPPTRTEWTTP